ncbi:hypothetical protein [Mycobacteroides abscessus]|uniref:hypothetical protein n=1 Tax=Mycobacteroides abscessus TaxID=36809 RepID=UPI002106CE13|nr:hypothetical protein [Mycobacteroides abscessus]
MTLTPLTQVISERMRALPTVDWTTVETAYPDVVRALDMLSDDPNLLTNLVRNAWSDPALRKKCEIHSLDDKIVLWDEPDKGLRIRLRLAHTQQYERVHNHRFSFAARILSGSYFQNLYDTVGPLDGSARVEDFTVVSSRIEPVGSTICIDHSQLHTTLTPPRTVSLMIQSPPKKRRSFIIRLSDGDVWWRLGEADETERRRQEVVMDDCTFWKWMRTLEDLGVIKAGAADDRG